MRGRGKAEDLAASADTVDATRLDASGTQFTAVYTAMNLHKRIIDPDLTRNYDWTEELGFIPRLDSGMAEFEI
jgi:hypothetical protein